MTTDLFFTLQLLDCFPELRLTADLSHYLVGREFAWPVDDTNHALIHRILDGPCSDAAAGQRGHAGGMMRRAYLTTEAADASCACFGASISRC